MLTTWWLSHRHRRLHVHAIQAKNNTAHGQRNALHVTSPRHVIEERYVKYHLFQIVFDVSHCDIIPKYEPICLCAKAAETVCETPIHKPSALIYVELRPTRCDFNVNVTLEQVVSDMFGQKRYAASVDPSNRVEG